MPRPRPVPRPALRERRNGALAACLAVDDETPPRCRRRARRRGNEQLLRYRNGDPITRRRYDCLWQRLDKHLPWVATQQVSTHWIRYTTLTWVERHFGYAVARAFAGHFGKSDAATTTTYVRATIEEVATALASLTNEEHPLAVTNSSVQ